MKSTIKIYIGRPVSGAEAKAVKRLHSGLSEQGIDALLLVNFQVRNRQIDCVVISPTQATLLDFKEITGPVRGGMNGPWFIRAHGGGETRYPGENPYVEVSTAKYALSDEMAKFQKNRTDIPAPRKGHFYVQFDAAVCICPDIVPDSSLAQGDFKCWIWGFPVALGKIFTRKIESSWTIENWERFAFHLNLEAVSLESATDQEFRKSELALLAYGERLTTVLGHGLPPELPHLAETLPRAEHFVLLGPSGIGKTIRLQRHALESINQPALVLFVEAMHYEGDFRALLQKAVAPVFSGKIEELRQAASICGAPTVLIMDGFDRCQASVLPNLVRGISAFHELCNCRIVIGSQFDPNLPPSIKSLLLQMSHLVLDQKLAVFRFHSGDSEFSDSALLEPFETAHDLMVAGKCRSNLTPGVTRTELYDAYIVNCLPKFHPTVAGALCRQLAAVLARDFASAMSRHDFEKEAEDFVTTCGVTLQVIDEVCRTEFVKLSFTDFSFSHELIQEHLYADYLCRTAEDFDVLVSELQKPAHRHLAQVALFRQKSADKVRTILRSMRDARLLEAVFHGRSGASARAVLLHDCHAFLSDAAADGVHADVVVEVSTKNGQRATSARAVWGRCRQWTDYDMCLAKLIGRKLDHPEFSNRAADLLGVSGASLRHAAATAAKSVGRSERLTIDWVLHACLVLQHVSSMECPAAEIFHAWRDSFKSKTNPDGPWARALREHSTNDSSGAQAFVIYALCELLEWAEPATVEALDRTFRLAWDSRLGQLRTKALEMLVNTAHGDASGSISQSEGIRSLLRMVDESLPERDKDIFTNTFLIEAMNAYGMIPPPVELESALAEMRSVLNPQSGYARSLLELRGVEVANDFSDVLAEGACRILGLFFEEVFQGVYCQAFHSLTEREQTAFMNLAGQAKDASFHLGYILGGLVKVCSPSSLPLFHRYAAKILFDSPSQQDAVHGFILAIIGCAKLNAELPPWQMEKSEATEAWRMLREIIYEQFKGASASAAMDDLWISLRAEALFGVADALLLMKSSFVFDLGDVGSTVNLVDRYPQHVKAIMEHSLLNLARLTSAWKYGQAPDHRRGRVDFVIDTLGRVGDRETIELLKRFADDPALGENAIAAIKLIRARAE